MSRRTASRGLTAIAVVPVLMSVILGIGLTFGPVATSAAAGSTSATAASVAKIDRTSRSAVLSAYRARYVAPLAVSNAWTGQVSGCTPGANSSAYTSATLSAVNWARAQAGIAPVVGTSPSYSTLAQSAALMMQAQHALSHQPTRPWTCWTSTGATGASRSLLALGAAGPRAVGLYLSDPGSGNTAAGHRRWLLRPRLATIGIGNTSGANAIYVIGTPRSANPAGTPAFYGWPTSGYFPRAAEPAGRWSLSSSTGCSFRYATVRVVGPGGSALRLTRFAPVSGMGDSTLVWQLASPPRHSLRVDQSYRVTVSGIRTPTGALRTVTYRVTLIS